MEKITAEEYEKARETVERYKYQQNPTVNVTMCYLARIWVELKAPKELSIEEIKETLIDNYYNFIVEEKGDDKFVKIEELYVSGEEIKLDA